MGSGSGIRLLEIEIKLTVPHPKGDARAIEFRQRSIVLSRIVRSVQFP